MSIISEFCDIFLEDMAFKMKTLPLPDENHSLMMGIGIVTKYLKKVDDIYQVNCILNLSIGKELTDETLKNSKYKIFRVDYKISFKVNDDSLLLDGNKKLTITSELNAELKALSEPYFKEIINNLFSRSEFPIPPIPLKFWRENDGIK